MAKRVPVRDMVINGKHCEAGKPVEVSENDERLLDEMGALEKAEDKPAKKKTAAE